jgi:protein neuralized
LRNNFTIVKSNNDDGNLNINFRDLIECVHCKNKFMPQKRFNIFNEGIIMTFNQGKTINFNTPIKDPIQLTKDKNMILNNSEIYKLLETDEKNNRKIIQLGQSVNNTTMIEQVTTKDQRVQCCFCLENRSESVFIPCGHRCVCFKCGEVIMKSQNKKCPICQEDAFYLLKRVYDC